VRRKSSLRGLLGGMEKMPQVLINVGLDNELTDTAWENIHLAVNDAEFSLAERGRVLLRMSGTEPLLRVMVEGENILEVQEQAKKLAGVVRSWSEKCVEN